MLKQNKENKSLK